MKKCVLFACGVLFSSAVGASDSPTNPIERKSGGSFIMEELLGTTELNVRDFGYSEDLVEAIKREGEELRTIGEKMKKGTADFLDRSRFSDCVSADSWLSHYFDSFQRNLERGLSVSSSKRSIIECTGGILKAQYNQYYHALPIHTGELIIDGILEKTAQRQEQLRTQP